MSVPLREGAVMLACAERSATHDVVAVAISRACAGDESPGLEAAGAREAILEGAPLTGTADEIWPLLVSGAVSSPLGLWVGSRGLYAKRHGKLTRPG